MISSMYFINTFNPDEVTGAEWGNIGTNLVRKLHVLDIVAFPAISSQHAIVFYKTTTPGNEIITPEKMATLLQNTPEIVAVLKHAATVARRGGEEQQKNAARIEKWAQHYSNYFYNV